MRGRKGLFTDRVAFCLLQQCLCVWDGRIKWQEWHSVGKAGGMTGVNSVTLSLL